MATSIAEHCRYFPRQKTLCYIAGYTEDGNTANVLKKIEFLNLYAEQFSAFAKVDISEVNTYYLYSSQKYEKMRVFFAKLEPEKVPTNVSVLPDWDMTNYLRKN